MRAIPDISGGGILGEKVLAPRRILDTFELPEGIRCVEYTSDEVTSRCPITSAPDFYTVTIYISETQLGLESKSVKLYLQSFREEGLFCEAFAAKIAKDVKDVVFMGHVEVAITQKPRGGVTIHAVAHA